MYYCIDSDYANVILFLDLSKGFNFFVSCNISIYGLDELRVSCFSFRKTRLLQTDNGKVISGNNISISECFNGYSTRDSFRTYIIPNTSIQMFYIYSLKNCFSTIYVDETS